MISFSVLKVIKSKGGDGTSCIIKKNKKEGGEQIVIY